MAIKARFGGNDESRRLQKSMLKQKFQEFQISEEEGIHKGYDRFHRILSQLNQLKARPDNEDCNAKFLRSLPPSWLQVSIALKTKGGLDLMSFDDLYNKLKSLEPDVRSPIRPSTHSAFVGASTKPVQQASSSYSSGASSQTHTQSAPKSKSSSVLEDIIHSFVAEYEHQ